MNGIALRIEIDHVDRHGGTEAAIAAEGFCYDYVYLQVPSLGEARRNPGAVADMLSFLVREIARGSKSIFPNLDDWRELAFSPDAVSTQIRNLAMYSLLPLAALPVTETAQNAS